MQAFAFIPELSVDYQPNDSTNSTKPDLTSFHTNHRTNDETTQQWIDSYSLMGEFILRVNEITNPSNICDAIKSAVVHSPALIRLYSNNIELDHLLDCLDFGISCIQVDASQDITSRSTNDSNIAHSIQTWLLDHSHQSDDSINASNWPLEAIPSARLAIQLSVTFVDGSLHVMLGDQSTTRLFTKIVHALKPFVCELIVDINSVDPSLHNQAYDSIQHSLQQIQLSCRIIIRNIWMVPETIKHIADKYQFYSTGPMHNPIINHPFSRTADLGEYLGSVLLQFARSDRVDGLYSTIVVDLTGQALGLVYSSVESILAACRDRRGVYWSRSRNSLWRKGETSGAVQYLSMMSLDCDSDALRFTVDQNGAGFCHFNRWTCWSDGYKHGLHGLMRTLVDRKLNPQPKSYTNRLLDDQGLLNSKILEEAQELIEATSHEDIANEAADLMYFAAVKLCSAGVSLGEVEHCLDTRSLRIRRRPGNAKPQTAANNQTKANIQAATHDSTPDHK